MNILLILLYSKQFCVVQLYQKKDVTKTRLQSYPSNYPSNLACGKYDIKKIKRFEFR